MTHLLIVTRTLFKTAAGKTVLIFTGIVLAYLIWILEGDYDVKVEQVVSSFITIGLNIAASIFGMSLWRTARFDRRVRRAWLLLCVAFVFQAIAEIVFFVYESISDSNRIFLTSYIFYLGYYALIFLGVLQFPLEGRENETTAIVWLDQAIVMTVTFMALWYFIPTPFELQAPSHMLQLISYPVAGSFVFAANVALIQRDLIKVAWWSLFFLGFGMFSSLLGDGFLAYFEVQGISYQMASLNTFWMVGPLFAIVAVACQQISLEIPLEQTKDRGSPRRFIRHVLPYLATIFGITLLVLAVQNHLAAPLRLHGIVIATIILVGLVLLRQDRVLEDNMRLYRELHQVAITDSLTGVYNRYFLDEVLQNEVLRAKRSGYSLSILMIDVNGFKSFNDRFGHLKGDQALRKIAIELSGCIRGGDFLGRYGGDEFIVIMPETDPNGAQILAEKMRQMVSQHVFESLRLDVTVGIASYNPEITVEQFLQQADQDLYRKKAKRSVNTIHSK